MITLAKIQFQFIVPIHKVNLIILLKRKLKKMLESESLQEKLLHKFTQINSLQFFP